MYTEIQQSKTLDRQSCQQDDPHFVVVLAPLQHANQGRHHHVLHLAPLPQQLEHTILPAKMQASREHVCLGNRSNIHSCRVVMSNPKLDSPSSAKKPRRALPAWLEDMRTSCQCASCSIQTLSLMKEHAAQSKQNSKGTIKEHT